MIRASLVFVFSSFFGLFACGSSESGGSATSSALSSGFASNCAGCHGSDAGGAQGPALGGNVGTIDHFTSVVRYGKGSMPSFSTSNYSDADLQSDFSSLK